MEKKHLTNIANTIIFTTYKNSILFKLEDLIKLANIDVMCEIIFEKYNKYKNMINKRNSLNNNGNRENQNKQAKQGMQILRARRPKDQIKEQRKAWDMKYNEKRKMTKEEAAQIIQRQYKAKKNKGEGEAITKDILNDIINSSFDYKITDGELKKKRGRKLK